MKFPKTINDIKKLRPEFQFGSMIMVEWFEVQEYTGSIFIRSGLRHADGETKSPYHYEEVFYGKDYKKRALEHFQNFCIQKLNLKSDFKFGK